jgi:hypothetical protein
VVRGCAAWASIVGVARQGIKQSWCIAPDYAALPAQSGLPAARPWSSEPDALSLPRLGNQALRGAR